MKNKKNALNIFITFIIITLIVGGLTFGVIHIKKETNTSYILVGFSQNGITFVNDEVDIYVIDFKKLDEDVDYKTIESEIYYFVNSNSRVYVLATKNEVTVYIYDNKLFVNFYDIKQVGVRNSKNKVDLRP